MSVWAKVVVPVTVWLVIGVLSIQQGRRLVRVGYEIGRCRGRIEQVRERNRQLIVQGSKLKSPTRVLTLAERLGLELEVVRTDELSERSREQTAMAPERTGSSE